MQVNRPTGNAYERVYTSLNVMKDVINSSRKGTAVGSEIQ